MKKCCKPDMMIEQIAFPGYKDLYELRSLIDDCLAGMRTNDEKRKYLPPTKWQAKYEDKYQAFLYRALFPSETKYSLDIYEGLFQIGDPQIVLPDDGRMNYLVNDASVYRDSLKQIQVRLNKEQMTHGLRMLLLEVRDDEERPFYIQEYGANKYIRGHFNSEMVSGESIADCVLLDETALVNDIRNWTYTKEVRLRILGLDRNMEYYQRSVTPEELKDIDIYKPKQDRRTIYPAFQGRRFNRIPLVWCGATGNSGSSLDQPPLLPMAQAELKLFLCMAHHSQHIFMSTQESIVITGASSSFVLEDDKFVAGSVVVIPGDNAKAQYLSTNGVGFTAEENEIAKLNESIEAKRLSLMSAKSHQSGTVIGMVQNSQSAPLRTIVTVSGNSISLILQHMARWMGYPEEEVETLRYIPSEAFANPKVNLSEFIALCKAVADGEVQMLEEELHTMGKESNFITSKLPWKQFKEKYDIEWSDRQKKQGVVADQQGNPFPGSAE